MRCVRGWTWRAVALLAALGLIVGCTGGGRHRTAQAGTAPNATAQAKEASAALVQMAGTIRSWKLDPGVVSQLLGQIGYVVSALEQGNWLGAQTLLSAWRSNAQTLVNVGVLPSSDGGQYQELAANVDRQLPDAGVVQPFTQSGAPVPPSACDDGGLAFLDFARVVAVKGLAQIPKVGGILSGFLALLWPEKKNESQWECLAGQLDALVHQHITQLVKEQLGYRLDTLEGKIDDYVKAIQETGGFDNASDARKKTIGGYWKEINNQLNNDYADFKRARNAEPYVFLPDFSQFMNIYFATLRDGILNGSQMGIGTEDPLELTDLKRKYTARYDDATGWTKEQYPAGRAFATNPANIKYRMEKPTTAKSAEKAAVNIDNFNAGANYDLFMTPAVKDQAFTWTYFDPVKYPEDVTVPPDTRVLFSPAAGSGAKEFKSPPSATGPGTGLVGVPTGDITPPAPPAKSISHVTVWTNCTRKKTSGKVPPICPASPSEAWVRGWRVDFGSQAGRTYGYQNGKAESFSIGSANERIIRVRGVAGLNSDNPIINSIAFVRSNKQVAGDFGNPQPASRGKSEKYDYEYPGEMLADVYSGGNFTQNTARYYGCSYHYGHGTICDGADETTWQAPSSVVFGFRLLDSLQPPPPVPPQPAPSTAAWITGNPLSVTDTTANDEAVPSALGDTSAVAATPNGRRVYLTEPSAGSTPGRVLVVDSADINKVVAAIGIPNLQVNSSIAVSPDGSRVYVTEPGYLPHPSQSARVGGKLWVINTADTKLMGDPLGIADANGVAVAPDGSHVYVANSSAFKVMVVDVAGNNPAHYKVTPVDLRSEPEAVAVAPDGRHVYATTPGFPGKLWTIDTKDDKVAGNPIDVGNNPKAVAVAPDGDHVYVANYAANTVSVVNTTNNTVGKIDVGNHPSSIAVTPDGRHVYVVNQTSHTVSVITTATNTIRSLTVGRSPRGVAISSRP